MWLFLVIMLSLGGNGLDIQMNASDGRAQCERERDQAGVLYEKTKFKGRDVLHITSCFYVPEPKAPPQLR